ncbi:MAG: DUF871 domain-containing protein [Schwartzia sp.]|nr:DUF871 domain-containing protein [Schwartzia sp. (in: firmicutes)]
MRYGISLYPSLDNTPEENRQLLRDAVRHGVTRLFTSLHIPETDRRVFAGELRTLLTEAREAGMEIIADTAPDAMELLGLDALEPAKLVSLGIGTLRLDEGFDPEDVARLSRNGTGLRLLLNASTVTATALRIMERERADFRNIEALHNFYPRTGTGLSEAFFHRQNELLAAYDIPVGAFVASRGRKRGPMHMGLPTLEDQREWSVDFAARFLAAVGVESIFIGDALPTEEELATLVSVRDGVTVRLRLLTHNEGVRELLSEPFTARPDEARDAIRALESRARVRQRHLAIPPEKIIPRHFGTVTLDNDDSPRYAGELQITRRPQPADPWVNVVGNIPEKDFFLLPYITPGRPFCFRVEQHMAYLRYKY